MVVVVVVVNMFGVATVCRHARICGGPVVMVMTG